MYIGYRFNDFRQVCLSCKYCIPLNNLIFFHIFRNLDNLDGIIYCLQRLIAICKDNDDSCIKLAKEGLISKLLSFIQDHVDNTKRTEICKYLCVIYILILFT